jgi:chorismate synthase
MKIVIAGPKGAGKSTLGKALSELTGLTAIETDRLIEDLYQEETGHHKSYRQIYVDHGKTYFRQLEKQVAEQMRDVDWRLVITGGSILLAPENRLALRYNAILVYFTTSADVAWERSTRDGVPPWLEGPDGREKFNAELMYRNEVIQPYADLVLNSTTDDPMQLAKQIRDLISQELVVRSRAANTYGDVIRITTFGESHGLAVGAVLDGIKPGVAFDLDEVQRQMNRRRPGQSQVTTPRSEKDRVEVLSGVFEGKTTGAPIAMVIFNRDQDPSKYEGIKDLFRPGHADFTYYKKYGIRDFRGGGRSSGRETASRVMCGAVARMILQQRGVNIVAHAIEIAGVRVQTCDYDAIEQNPVRCADPQAAEEMVSAIMTAKDDSDSVGGVIQLEITGVPVGLGDPVFEKLDARLTRAIMTLGAVKAIEIGKGFELTRMRGSESNDQMGKGGYLTNNAGGISGGISTGQPILMRVGVKPTSSIAKPQRTIDKAMMDKQIETHGRHDPCIVPRVIPVIENMTALALLDAWEVQVRINPKWPDKHT